MIWRQQRWTTLEKFHSAARKRSWIYLVVRSIFSLFLFLVNLIRHLSWYEVWDVCTRRSFALFRTRLVKKSCEILDFKNYTAMARRRSFDDLNFSNYTRQLKKIFLSPDIIPANSYVKWPPEAELDTRFPPSPCFRGSRHPPFFYQTDYFRARR